MLIRTGIGDLSPQQQVLQQQMSAGNPGSIWYCNTIGLLLDPTICGIKSQAQLRQQQIDELSKTSMTPENQAAAVSNADAVIQADYASHPGDYAAQEAAAGSPFSSALFGPGFIAWLTGQTGNPSGQTAVPGWIWIAGAGVLVIAMKGR